jgi:hypothetical protein
MSPPRHKTIYNEGMEIIATVTEMGYGSKARP